MILNVINHIIHQSPEVRAQSQNSTGRSFGLAFLYDAKKYLIDKQGYWCESTLDVDVELLFEKNVLFKWIKGEAILEGDVVIKGDKALGLAILSLINQLKYYPEVDLTNVLGLAWSGWLYNRFSFIKNNMGEVKKRFFDDVVDYGYEKETLLVSKAGFDLWVTQIDELKEEVVHLENRINHLKDGK